MHRTWMMACALSALGLGANAAHAATADTTNAAQQTTTVGDLVVTAEKREESLERVPVAVSAYTSKERDLVGIDTIQDITKFTPGLEYSTSLDRAFIRGVGRQTNNLASQPGVATYFDGVYNSSVTAAAGDSLFINRVEVLRGPQGTLYGKNAIGGAINAISIRPTDDFYAEVRADLGNYGVYNVEGAVSGPIVKGLDFRIAAYRDDQQQGYFKNVSGTEKDGEGGNGVVEYVEGQLQAKAGAFDGWLKLNYVTADVTYRSVGSQSPYDETPFPPGGLSPGAAFGYTQPGFTSIGPATQNPGETNIRDYSTNTPNRAHTTDDYNISTQDVWHFPGVDLKYIGGYTHYLYNLQEDYDATSLTSYQFPVVPSFICYPAASCPPLTVYPTVIFNYQEDKTYYSNELNLTSTGSGPFQWILGAFEYHEEFHQFIDFPEPGQAQLATPLGAPADPTRDVYDAEQTMHSDSYAGFAQADWQVLPTVKLTGGIRYTYDQQSGIEYTRQVCFGLPSCGAPAAVYGAYTPALDITQYLISFAPAQGVVGPPTLNAATGYYTRALSASWSAPTGTLGVEWTPDAATLVYAKYSRGYKAGGFNSGAIVASPETQAEYLDAYEIGGKRDFGRTFQANLALFYYNYQGMQIPLSVQPTTGPATTQFFNMGDVVSYGAELESIWRPTDDLQFIFSYAYLSARIRDTKNCFVDGADPLATAPGANTSGCPTGGAQNVNGESVPESPPNKLALNGAYTLHFEPGSLSFSGTFSWQDRTYDSIFNRYYTLAPAYDTVDLRLVWNDVKNRYTVIVYGKNVFNSLGYDNAGAVLQGNGTITRNFGLVPPATYGVEVQYRFR